MSDTFITSPHQIAKFQSYIHRFYEQHGRHDLPWRLNYDPYHILVSEIMLQQTQVDRVIAKYNHFLKLFPTVEALAQAPQSSVITAWQGLGYNRRGLRLQQAAQKIAQELSGVFPATLDQLLSLPGIGPYTAAAITAFAFNLPSIVIETNIRTVFIFHFFHEAYNVSDDELITFITATLDREKPRLWYSALMDYGTYLKKTFPNPSRKSKSYSVQAPLAGSNRQARGLILKALTLQPTHTTESLQTATQLNTDRLNPALHQLIQEGFLTQHPQTNEIKLVE